MRRDDETRTRAYVAEGMSRSDAQSIVEAENAAIDRASTKMMGAAREVESKLGDKTSAKSILKAIEAGELGEAMEQLNTLKAQYQNWSETQKANEKTDETNMWKRLIGEANSAVFALERAKVSAEYAENEGYNAHSENVVLMAKTVGDLKDIRNAESILDLHMRRGELTPDLQKDRDEIYRSLKNKFEDFLRGKPDRSKTGGMKPRDFGFGASEEKPATGLLAPGTVRNPEDRYAERRGARADLADGLRAKDITKLISADFKSKEAKELGFTKVVSARTPRWNSIQLKVQTNLQRPESLKDKETYWKAKADHAYYPERLTPEERQFFDKVKDMGQKAYRIAGAYNVDKSDIMTDYFDVRYHHSVSLTDSEGNEF